MSYDTLSTYIAEKTSVFLQVCCGMCDMSAVFGRSPPFPPRYEVVNIGGLRCHLLPTARVSFHLVSGGGDERFRRKI